MSEGINLVYQTIDEQHADESAHTRRQLVAGAAAVLGGLGVIGALAADEAAGQREPRTRTDPQTILNVAATAEVLATIVNTEAHTRMLGGDAQTRRNIEAAAREELIHFDVLTSSSVGGKQLTKQIHVPDAVLSSRDELLKALVVGDQVFINAYLIGTTSFGNAGNGRLARIAAEFMGTEAVHRALALQSLGVLGNDRAFMRYSQGEENRRFAEFNVPGFRRILSAVTVLESAGFGFGKAGSKPGRMFDLDEVRKRTPNPEDVNTREPR